MRLFGTSPKPGPEPSRLRVHHPWNPPEAEIPAIVPVSTLRSGQSGQAAVAITGLLAYSQGFEITVTRLIRPGILAWTKTSPRRGTPAYGITETRVSMTLNRSSTQPAEVSGPGRRARADEQRKAHRQNTWCPRGVASSLRVTGLARRPG